MDTWVPILAEVTAYCPCSKCCGLHAAGITADGSKTIHTPYNLAGDIYNFNFGDQIFIPLGSDVLDNVRRTARIFTVDDRGGALNTEARSGERVPRLDLRVKEHWWAVRFGRKQIIIYLRK
jgi:hypothetical protein